MEATEPIIAALVLVLTLALRWAAERRTGKARTLLHHYSPAIAAMLAVALQAAWLAMASEDAITIEALGRGFLAGTMAVWGHSQYRAVLRHLAEGTLPEAPPVPEDEKP